MKLAKPSVLVTGAAGFIGYFLCARLAADGYSVTGIDNLNNYYDTGLKHARLQNLKKLDNFHFIRADIASRQAVENIFSATSFSLVIHLAAQAGVRFSISDPHAYIPANISGFFNILNAAKNAKVEHFLYASSSSVYGERASRPFQVDEPADYPVNLYAATKRSNELMAYAYSGLYDLPSTGLRFFTVYGPWGRPDMAYFKFTRAILAGETIKVFNHGNMARDFTYIDDVVEAVVRLIDLAPRRDGARPPWNLYNIGRNRPEKLMDMIHLIETRLGKKANIEMLDMQPGEITTTYADSTPLIEATGYKPVVSLEQGIDRFVGWYVDFYDAEPARKA